MKYAYPPEKDFKTLKEPARNRAFGWFVMTANTTFNDLLFLATDSTIRVREKTGGFFFKTELDAHYAAEAYYDRHGWEYPHSVEMLAVEMLAAAETELKFKSQTMEFK